MLSSVLPVRYLIHIPRGTAKAVLYALVLGVVGFFALTRTQVGRDGLRAELERRFEHTFAGSLRIQTLHGNLVNTLFARDVRIYDPDGRLVMSVDSVIIRPSWRDLFRQELSLSEVTLIHPSALLRRSVDGRWNIAETFATRHPDTTRAPTDWAFSTSRIQVVDGVIETANAGAPPDAVARGLVFDYAGTRIDHLELKATVESRQQYKQIDILGFEGVLTDPELAVTSLTGQVVLENHDLAVNELVLKMGENELRLNGSAGNVLPPGDLGESGVDLHLSASPFDVTPLRRLFPRLPLHGFLALETRLRGPLSDLVVETAGLSFGSSHVSLEGTLAGYPDSVYYELSMRDAYLVRSDVDRLWPGLIPAGHPTAERLSSDVFMKGVYYPATRPGVPRLKGEAYVDVRSDAGMIQGTVALALPVSAAPHYALDLETTGLNLAGFLPVHPSNLSGRLRAAGSGFSPDSLAGTLALSLHPSSVAGLHIDSLAATMEAADGVLTAGLRLFQPGGALHAEAGWDYGGRDPAYTLDLTADRFDLGTFLRLDSLRTDLSTHLTLNGSGLADPALQAELDLSLSPSTMRWGRRTREVAAHRLRVRLAPRFAGGARVIVTSDLLEASVEGDVPIRGLTALGRLWRDELARGFAGVLDKPRRAPTDDFAPTPVTFSSSPMPDRAAMLRVQAREALLSAGVPEALHMRATLAVHDGDQLTALLPFLPAMQARFTTAFTVEAAPGALAVTGRVAVDTLRLGAIALKGLAGDLSFDAGPGARFVEALESRWIFRADTLTLGGQQFVHPRLDVDLSRGRGRVAVHTARGETLGPVRLAARVALLPDRNHVTLDTLQVRAGTYTWTGAEGNRFDVYRDALVMPSLRFTSPGPTASMEQSISLHGTYSTHPADTAFVATENIALRTLVDFLRVKPHIGGLMQGKLAYTHRGGQPELTGDVSVDALALDQYILGDLDVTSRYDPGSASVRVALDLVPTSFPDTAFVFGTTIPAAVKENRLGLSGGVRLPRFSSSGAVLDPGSLALSLDVDRADLFFFKILIGALDNLGGYVEGTGTIGGTFKRPLFGADMHIREGRFSVPDINVHYAITSPVTVDSVGIHVPEATITDPSGGSVALTGSILFNDYKYFSFDLQGALDRLQIIDVAETDALPFYGHIWASGNATLTGPLYSAHLRSTDAVTTPESELFVPVEETATGADERFIIFADSTGRIPDLKARTTRKNLLASRPVGERPFLEGIDLDIDLFAPRGSTVHLVIDPLLGDVINAVSTGQIQIQRREGDFRIFGTLEVSGGDYLFTAGEVFFRRFLIEPGGTISWDGDPINALLSIPAAYRTRASRAGLPASGANDQSLIPLIVNLQISGRVIAPEVDLRLAIDRSEQNRIGDYQGLETLLNQPERATEYATSVLLTNSFRLTTSNINSGSGSQLAFNSVSQLVSTQLNRFINEALPNVDFNFGLQGESAQDLDVTYGVALRLLDERLIIRGEGVYTGSGGTTDNVRTAQQSLQGEFVVEVRLNPSVSVEVFYRREGDALTSNATLTNTTGAGFSYQTEFSSWKRFFYRLFGWLLPDRKEEAPPPGEKVATSEKQ